MSTYASYTGAPPAGASDAYYQQAQQAQQAAAAGMPQQPQMQMPQNPMQQQPQMPQMPMQGQPQMPQMPQMPQAPEGQMLQMPQAPGGQMPQMPQQMQQFQQMPQAPQMQQSPQAPQMSQMPQAAQMPAQMPQQMQPQQMQPQQMMPQQPIAMPEVDQATMAAIQAQAPIRQSGQQYIVEVPRGTATMPAGIGIHFCKTPQGQAWQIFQLDDAGTAKSSGKIEPMDWIHGVYDQAGNQVSVYSLMPEHVTNLILGQPGTVVKMILSKDVSPSDVSAPAPMNSGSAPAQAMPMQSPSIMDLQSADDVMPSDVPQYGNQQTAYSPQMQPQPTAFPGQGMMQAPMQGAPQAGMSAMASPAGMMASPAGMSAMASPAMPSGYSPTQAMQPPMPGNMPAMPTAQDMASFPPAGQMASYPQAATAGY